MALSAIFYRKIKGIEYFKVGNEMLIFARVQTCVKQLFCYFRVSQQGAVLSKELSNLNIEQNAKLPMSSRNPGNTIIKKILEKFLKNQKKDS